MLFSVEQALVGRDEKRAPLKTPAWEASVLIVIRLWYRLFIDDCFRLKTLVVNLNSVGSSALEPTTTSFILTR